MKALSLGCVLLVVVLGGCDKRSDSSEKPSPKQVTATSSTVSSVNQDSERYSQIIRMQTEQQKSLEEQLKQAEQTIEDLQTRLTQAEQDRDLAVSEFKLTLDAAQDLKKNSASQGQTLQELQTANQQLQSTVQQLNTEINRLYNQLGTTRVTDPNQTN